MSLGELYGEYDLSTDEWADGVLSSLMRSACAGVKTLKTYLSAFQQTVIFNMMLLILYFTLFLVVYFKVLFLNHVVLDICVISLDHFIFFSTFRRESG